MFIAEEISLLSNIGQYLLSFFIGITASYIATKYYTDVYLSGYKLFSFIARCKLFSFLKARSPIFFLVRYGKKLVFNNVILLHADYEDLSKIAGQIMAGIPQTDKNIFIITNTREPNWFWNEFYQKLESKKGIKECKEALDLMDNIMIAIKGKDNKKAEADISTLRQLFFNKSKPIQIFSHLWNFVNSNVGNRIRANIFDSAYDLKGNILSEFLERNKNYFLFFEEFINYDTKSIIIPAYDFGFDGKDALIINHKYVLDMDYAIKEITYQKNDLINKIREGFYHHIVTTYNYYITNNKYSKNIYDGLLN